MKLFDDSRINIIPIWANSKRPAVKWEQYQHELYPRDKLKHWVGNFAAVCGKISNNLTIVDIDHFSFYERFLSSLETSTVKTPNNGVHLYFYSKKQVKKTPKYLGYPVDVQGEGSYALCPPSSIDERKYEIIKDLEISEVDDVFALLNSHLPVHNERAEDLEEFKHRIDFSNIVERYVRSEYQGKGYWQGYCSFHNDRAGGTPSLTVYKENFYCFGCGKNGDVITFIELIEKVDFKGAVKKLEELTGIKYFKERKEPTEKKACSYIKDGKFIAEILADEVMSDYKFITTRDNEEIFYYNDGIYHLDAETIIKEEVKSRLGEETTEHRANEVLFQIKASTYVKREEINKYKNLVHLENGIFDLEKMALVPFSEDIISTVKLPIKYEPNADCPKIKKFLTEILAEDDIPIIQELFGYTLLKDYPIQKAFMFVGEGANGKSTLLALLKSFLGSKNVSSIALQDLETNRFASSALYDKLANIYADLTDRAMHQTGKFKMLTGGDMIPGEKKFRDSFSFVNYAKLIFSANKLPETRDDTSAFFRRWIIINFPNIFEGDKADPKILEKLTTEEELSGIFNWAVEGLKTLLRNGCFSYSKTTEDVRDLYERMASPLLAFIKDRVELDPESYVLKDCFYSEFVNYCKKNKLPTKAKNVIGLELPRYIPSIKSERKRVGNDRVYVWIGIKLIEKSAEPVQAVQVVRAFSYFKSNGSNSNIYSIDKIKIEKNIDRLDHLGQKRALDLEDWCINHLKNHKGIPETFFVNDALKMFPSANPAEIQDFYEFLVDAKRLSEFIKERKRIRETDTYRDLKFTSDYNKKLLLFLISQKEITIEEDPPPWKGEWYVYIGG